MEPLHQPLPHDCFRCPYSQNPVTKICVYYQCNENNPLVCDSCEDQGCCRRHTHQNLKKHVPFQDVKNALQNLVIPSYDISQHLKEMREQLANLISDLEVMLGQHYEFLSGNSGYKVNDKALSILTLIQSNQWQTISGANLDYVLNKQIFQTNPKFQEIVNHEKTRVYRIFESIRKSIGDYYYTKEKKSIKEHLKEAESKKNSGRWKEAIQEYSRVLELYPNHGEALCYRGLCYSFQKEYDRALTDYQKCLQIDPRHSLTMSNIGHIYSIKKQKPMSLIWYNKSLSIDPNNHITLFNRAVVYLSIDKFKEAEQDLVKALEIQVCSQYYKKLSKCYELLNQKQKAVECLSLADSCKK